MKDRVALPSELSHALGCLAGWQGADPSSQPMNEARVSSEISVWRYAAPNEIHVSSSAGWLFRLLGLPFIAMGAYLFYLLFASLYEYWQEATFQEWLVATPGFLVLCAIGMAFLAPGWLLAFTRVRTEIDGARGEVREIRDFLVHKRVKRHPRTDFDRVEVGLEEIKYRHHAAGSYRTVLTNQIALKGDSVEPVVVGLIDDDAKAEELGREVATLLQVAHSGLDRSDG